MTDTRGTVTTLAVIAAVGFGLYIVVPEAVAAIIEGVRGIVDSAVRGLLPAAGTSLANKVNRTGVSVAAGGGRYVVNPRKRIPPALVERARKEGVDLSPVLRKRAEIAAYLIAQRAGGVTVNERFVVLRPDGTFEEVPRMLAALSAEGLEACRWEP